MERRNRKRIKPCPLTRQSLDDRTSAARLYDTLQARLVSDLGGAEHISTVQQLLINALVGVYIRLEDMSAKGLLGQEVTLSELTQAASTVTRLASRLGLTRKVVRDEGPTLVDLLRGDAA